ncbi:hypothetical protein DV736_g1849, partial [Chaetothyriales sp. CBS 134916]
MSPSDRQDDDEDPALHLLLPRRAIMQFDDVGRYYGLDSMYAWCVSFKDFVLREWGSRTSSKFSSPARDYDLSGEEEPSDLLSRCTSQLLKSAQSQDLLDVRTTNDQILLPPKQLLLMVHTRFFHQNDWSTNLFVRSRFWNSAERVYDHYSPSTDEAWAIVFNSIVLLSLGTETPVQGHDSLVDSQFAQPFFSTIRAAISNLNHLLAPKLVNVQALALLSLAAELFYPPGIAASIFAHACTLARQMGLDEVDIATGYIDPTEQEERLKVYHSLYIRDKSLAISRGTVCWLSGGKNQRLSGHRSGSIQANDSVRIRVSAFQERVCHLQSPVHTQGCCVSSRSGFSQLGAQNRIIEPPDMSTIFGSDASDITDIDLWLEFLAARIIVLRRNPKLRYVHRTLQDSRACCILFLMALGRSNDHLKIRLSGIFDSMDGPQPSDASYHQPAPFLSRSLFDMFPVSAIFLIAANIIRPVPGEEVSAEDLDLLSRVSYCYKEVIKKIRTLNRAHQIGQALEKLLEIIELMNGMTSSNDLTLMSATSPVQSGSPITLSSQSFPFDMKPSVSLRDLVNMEQLPLQGYVSSGEVSRSATSNDCGQSLSSYQSSGLDLNAPFVMDAQPTSNPDSNSQFPINDNMVIFDDPDYAITPSSLHTISFAMSTSLLRSVSQS